MGALNIKIMWLKVKQDKAGLYKLDELGGIILVNDVAREPTDTILAEVPIKNLEFIADRNGKFFLKVIERDMEPIVKYILRKRLREFLESR